MRASRRFLVLGVLVVASACMGDDGVQPPDDGRLAIGTWGGDQAGLIVDDTVAHVHVGCTFGNFSGPVTLDAEGRFSVQGSYVLRAYPIMIGPSLPASFEGTVRGNKLVLSIAVNDTVEKKMVQVGPVTVTFHTEPRMGPCPICASSAMQPTPTGKKPASGDPRRVMGSVAGSAEANPKTRSRPEVSPRTSH